MNQKELRSRYSYLMEGKSINSAQEFLNIYSEFFFDTILNHHKEDVYTYYEADAKIMLQMIFTKVLHIDKFLSGVEFKPQNGESLSPIFDPTILASLTRNLYETVGMFNLINVSAQSDEVKKITHALWVVSGLKYRQRFNVNANSDENKDKAEKERIQIESITKEIKSSELYASLNEKNQKRIDRAIKEKDFQISIEDGEVRHLGWQEFAQKMNLKGDIFENIYTYFSLYAHPSNVSVFQFQDMFGKEERAFETLTLNNMKYSLTMLSVFVTDYIKAFPQVKETYEKQDILNQIMLNAYNQMVRKESVNDSWKALG